MTSKHGPEQAASVGERPPEGWLAALDDLERRLKEATLAAATLREMLQPALPEPPAESKVRELSRPQPVEATVAPEATAGPQEQEADSGGEAVDAFERVWSRLEAEKLEKHVEPPSAAEGEDVAAKVTSKLASLPGSYVITVEDRESKVDLVSLHRALVSLEGAEEVTLVSFANGVPVVSLRMVGELDFEKLSKSVGMAMDRECEVIPHDSSKLFLRLTPHEEEER
jgi:hypothetical protein